MTYRDEEAARAARLDALERELTQIERTARGLEALIADRDEQPRDSARRLRTRSMQFGRTFGMAMGVIGGTLVGLLVSGSGCFYLSSESRKSSIDVAMSGAISESTRPLSRAGDACIASVAGTTSTDHGCAARVTCGSVVLYAGTARCHDFDDEGVVFRDERTDDGTPACLISEHGKVAAIRSATWTASIDSLTARR